MSMLQALAGYLASFLGIPLVFGLCYRNLKKDGTMDLVDLLTWGNFIFWAVFQLIAVPFIFCKATMSALTLTLLALTAVVGVWDIFLERKNRLGYKRLELPIGKRRDWESLLVLLAIVALVAVEVYYYVFLMHTDADDSEFVALSTEAYQNNTLLTLNPLTGSDIFSIPLVWVKRGINPFVLLMAFYSVICDIHPAAFCHTVFPTAAMVYLAMTLLCLGRSFFPEKKKNGQWFTLFAEVALLAGCQTVYTNGSFAFLRIWQGKAALVTLVLPMLLGVLWQQKPGEKIQWDRLWILGLAGVLTSGISIITIPLMVMSFAIYDAIHARKGRIFWQGILACLPVVVYAAYYVIRYLMI